MKTSVRCFLAGVGIFTALVSAGCGAAEGETQISEETLELHEPEGVFVSTEPAARRNLYNANVYGGAVYPYVEEYSFPVDQQFGSYGALLGDTVQKGDILVYADAEELSEKEEALEEKLGELTKEYEKFRVQTEETLYEQRLELGRLESILENLRKEEPEEYIPKSESPSPEPEEGDLTGVSGIGEAPDTFPGEGNPSERSGIGESPDASSGKGNLSDTLENREETGNASEGVTDEEQERVVNPEYTSWRKEYLKWEGEYNLKDWNIAVNEESLRQKRELYELDYGYYNGLLQELKDQRKDRIVTSQMSGVVVNIGYYIQGDIIPRGVSVAAVADMEQKYIKCSYIGRRLLTDAADIYAFIGGKRYEVVLKDSDRSMTTFLLQDEKGEVETGDYAVLVVVSDFREQVLAVPLDTVYTEGTEQVVYVEENGQTVSRQVETGMSDGVYVEILSGLEEGEEVISQTRATGKNVAVLERGVREIPYTGTAFLYFPVKTVVRNTVEFGKVIFGENQLRVNQHVEKGELLASITVEADRYEIASREAALRRAKERLADLEAEGREEDKETITESREKIAEQERELVRIKADSGKTHISSPVEGFLEYLGDNRSGMLMEPGAVAAIVADESLAYLAVDTSQNKTLNYGDVLTISYEDDNGEKQTAECWSLNLGIFGLGEDFPQNRAMFGISRETLENMPRVEDNRYGPQIRLYRPTGFVGRMENVVMVPEEAVTVQGGRTYVNVLGEDGSVTPVGFLAGGTDGEYYWVIEGLTEGTKICWD